MTTTLDKSTLFAHVSEADVEVLLGACPLETLLEGDLLFAEGDDGDALWIIERGRVEIYKTIRPGLDRVMTTLGPGSVLGEMSFLDGQRRSASARAAEPTDIRTLARSTFDTLIQTHPTLAAGFFAGLSKVLSERLRFTNELYRQGVVAWMEATRTKDLNIERLMEGVELLTLHLAGGSSVTGRIVEFASTAAGWLITLQDERGRVSLVPYHALVRIETV
ncbi:cyclic nucleotide-binding domain-containing protein [Myxococcota bacterium]|nr:cyclic nucleotide-binding domain-containing protein [Myxococcota bacterium]